MPLAFLSGPKGSIPGFSNMKVLNPPDDKLRDAIKQTGAKVVTSMFFGTLNLSASRGYYVPNLIIMFVLYLMIALTKRMLTSAQFLFFCI